MKYPRLKKIFLLYWKNLIVLRRQYVVTALEVLLPSLFVCGLAYIKTQDGAGGLNDVNEGFDGVEWNDRDLIDLTRFAYAYRGREVILGFTPDEALTKTIMNGFLQQLCRTEVGPCNFVLRGFGSEEELEAFHSSMLTPNDMDDSGTKFGFGVVFEGLNSNQVSYKIRMDTFYDTKTLIVDNIFQNLFTSENSVYQRRGFSGVQIMIDRELFKLQTGSYPTFSLSLRNFPEPPSKAFDLADLYNIFLPIFIVTGFVFVIPSVVRGVVSEKETGIKELLKMSGLPDSFHWLGWMLNSCTVLVITVTIIVVILFAPFSSGAGAVFEKSDPTLLWVILMIYAVWTTTYCFLVSSCFEKPTLATTIGVVVWLVSFYGLGFQMEIGYAKDWTTGLKLLLSLLPNVGINLALSAYCKLEASGKGAKWGTMADSLSSVNSLTILSPLLMLIASSILNTLLCMYLEAIIPKKFGIRKPFYFIFQPSEWGLCRTGAKRSDNNCLGEPNSHQQGIEKDPANLIPKVDIQNLSKQFGGNTAVDKLSLKMFPGQIFCLLGENGAGKTTTMSILTGIFPPTSGTAIINNYDITTNMTEIRDSLGLCPQHNMLFDKLTVIEHLKFFGMLRGMSAKQAVQESDSLLESLRIKDKKHNLGASLSGGQKRRLSLGCSIIGGSKILFLDEPTSGLDPEARRVIWDLLLQLRQDRVICLTTHFMEEADVLGDRIAILSNGRLQCCGSPNFLKKYYGTGYALAISVYRNAKKDTILQCIQKHVPGAYVQTSHSSSDSELSIVLPSSSHITASFRSLFADLQDQQKYLGIDKIGVGWTTMDDVFVRAQSHQEDEVEENMEETSISYSKTVRLQGLALGFSQLYGLLVKKTLWSIRRKRISASQIVIPALLTIIAVAVSRNIYAVPDRIPPLRMTLASYKNPITLYHSTNERIGSSYASVVQSSAKRIGDDLVETLKDIGKEDLALYREKYIVAAEMNDTHMTAMHSNAALHSAPLSLNLLTNALFRANGIQDYSIEVINHPLANNIHEILRAVEQDVGTLGVSFAFSVLVSMGMVLMVGSFLVMPTEERLCKGKQLQIMTGVNPLWYWGSMFICDFSVILVAVCLMTAFLPIFESYNMFTNNNGAGVFILLMCVYGAASLSLTYVVSTFVRTVAGGFTLIIIVNTLTGLGLGITSIILDSVSPKDTIALCVIGRFFPSFGLVRGSARYADLAAKNSKCAALSEKALGILCNPNFASSYYAQDCCANCQQLGNGKCFEPEPFFSWSRLADKDVHVPDFTQDILWQAVIGVAYLFILILIEYDVFALLLESALKQKASIFKRTVTDTDVLEETQRVDTLVHENRTSEDALVVHNLCKSYESFSAVSSLSFGVHHGECFGLLGVNGAGKTTTFRMLTGDENRTNGNSFLNNLCLERGRKEFLANIGYCPQFDGIVGVLTGRENLVLFARLRGLSSDAANKNAELWLARFGLLKSGDVHCQHYSGGMKRRLSAAMALIGDPPVILFDEPTSGVDPVARRQFWKIISSVRNTGQAMILTSHSMEECEALCSRLGIMVNGEMQCLGGVQHLKNKFAQGYSLFLKLKQEHYENIEMVNQVIAEILHVFHPCTLKDHHQATLKFQIHFQETPWNMLYETMERVKQTSVCVEEYAITETTLEEVFLSFARTQYANERLTSGGNIFTKCCH